MITHPISLELVAVLFLATISASAQSTSAYLNTDEIRTKFLEGEIKNYTGAAWAYSFIGEYQKGLEAFDKSGNPEPISPPPTNALSGYTATDANSYIVEKAKSEKVVIINEAHHQPRHRVFSQSLLEGLYKNGYRYLGVETLAEDSVINVRKWPLVSDGYYSREPQFGNFLRSALRIGFKVFAYEAFNDPEGREIGQAKNIMRVLKSDPSAKIFIHCGFGHVLEDTLSGGDLRMAGALKKLSGIDPLTIDQVDWTEYSDKSYESPYFQSAQVGYSAVFVNTNNKPYGTRKDSSAVDMKVAHMRTDYVKNRPKWLLRDPTWVAYDLSKSLINAEFPCIIAAFAEGEDDNAVPVDQVEVRNSQEKCLILPRGNYTLKITGRGGGVQKAKIVVH